MSRVIDWMKSLWQRSMLHRALLVAPPVALVLLAGYWQYGARPATQYYTAKVEKGDIAQVVQATGTINAVTTVQVGSQVSGNIAQLFADFNSHVTKGQVIAQIDPAIFRAQIATSAPASASASATARPIPLLPPVTSATRPVNESAMLLSSPRCVVLRRANPEGPG